MGRQFKSIFPEIGHETPSEIAAQPPETRTGPAHAGIKPLFSLPVSPPKAARPPLQPASWPANAAPFKSPLPSTPGLPRTDAGESSFSRDRSAPAGTTVGTSPAPRPFAPGMSVPTTPGQSSTSALNPSAPQLNLPATPGASRAFSPQWSTRALPNTPPALAPTFPFAQEQAWTKPTGSPAIDNWRGQVAGGKNGTTGDATSRARGHGPRRSRVALVSVLLVCCVGLLLLAGGGYLLTRPGPAKNAAPPVAQTTQIPDAIPPTGKTPGTAPTAKPRITNLAALNPVPETITGQPFLIMVSLSQQKLTAYDHDKPVLTTLVTTGQPALFTPPGTYHIFQRVANIYLYSKWPPGSPYYYAPVHVNYVLKLTTSGIYIHDATWRSAFGPGTNVPHTDPVYGQETGSHGCVETPITAMKWLYNRAPLQTSVIVVE